MLHRFTFRDAKRAECPVCGTVFRGVDRDEDGAPEVPAAGPCALAACGRTFCTEGCEERTFVCDCGHRFCRDHAIAAAGVELCPECAIQFVEDEPECCCCRVDVDSYDARGCEFHDLSSSWNRFRAAMERAPA